MNVPADLKYYWITSGRSSRDNIVTMGITAFAVEQLGDIVFVDLPRAATRSRRTAPAARSRAPRPPSDVFSPVTGKVVEVNSGLSDAPRPSTRTRTARAGW
jgi:glycine cleavage system H protein